MFQMQVSLIFMKLLLGGGQCFERELNVEILGQMRGITEQCYKFKKEKMSEEPYTLYQGNITGLHETC